MVPFVGARKAVGFGVVMVALNLEGTLAVRENGV
jgi:hypothetical protein